MSDPETETPETARTRSILEGLGPIGLGVFLFVLGIGVGFPLTIVGNVFLTQHVGVIVGVLLALLFAVCLVGVLLLLFRRAILGAVFRVTSSTLEQFAEPLGAAAKHIADRRADDAISSAEELTRLAFARWAWVSTRRWLIASLTGLLAAMAALAGTALLFQQNELLAIQTTRLEQQNDLLTTQIGLSEAQRSAEILPSLVEIGVALAEETEGLAKADGRDARVFTLDEISVGLRGRMVAASLAVRPYRYLQGTRFDVRDSEALTKLALARRPEILGDPSVLALDGPDNAESILIDRQVSPERGMLISMLFNSGIYDTERLSFVGADFSYAEVRLPVLNSMSFSFARLRYASFRFLALNEAKFGAAELEHARFTNSVLMRCDFSGLHFGALPEPYKGDPSMEIMPTSLTGTDFSDSLVIDSKFDNVEGLAMMFESAVVAGSSFGNASISGTSFRNAIIAETDFSGASLKAVELDGALVTRADFLQHLAETAQPETFKADRFAIEKVDEAVLAEHPQATRIVGRAAELVLGKPLFRIKRVGEFR